MECPVGNKNCPVAYSGQSRLTMGTQLLQPTQHSAITNIPKAQKEQWELFAVFEGIP